MKRIRRIIVAGLLVWLPLGVTIFIIRLLLDLLGQTYKIIPEFLRPESILGFSIPGFEILLALVIIFATGLIAANFIGKSLVDWWESFLDKIPLVRNIYSPLKKFSELILSDQTQSFSKVLLIEYPRKGLYSLCFQTSKNLGEIEKKSGRDVVCVFVPTPNTTSAVIILGAIPPWIFSKPRRSMSPAAPPRSQQLLTFQMVTRMSPRPATARWS